MVMPHYYYRKVHKRKSRFDSLETAFFVIYTEGSLLNIEWVLKRQKPCTDYSDKANVVLSWQQRTLPHSGGQYHRRN
jgi:hypothetical protein